MALVSFFTPQWHGTCALRFWLLWEALSSQHKRPATNEMKMQFCFVKGLNTKTLISLMVLVLRSSHFLPTAARVKRRASEVRSLIAQNANKKKGEERLLAFFPSLARPKLLLASQVFRSPLQRLGKKRLLHKLC